MFGLAIGIMTALAGGNLISTLLYEVRAGDPWTLASVAALLALVSAASCWAPARRAATQDPLEALRYE